MSAKALIARYFVSLQIRLRSFSCTLKEGVVEHDCCLGFDAKQTVDLQTLVYRHLHTKKPGHSKVHEPVC